MDSDIPASRTPPGQDDGLDALQGWLAVADEASGEQLRPQLIAALESVCKASPHPKVAFEAVMAADRTWHTLSRSKSLLYRRNPAGATADPARFQREMAAIERLFGEFYAGFVDAISTEADVATAESLQQATAHALLHFGKHVKWLSCNREQPEAGMWRRFHELLLLSMRQQFATRPVTLFRNESLRASCGQLWLRTVMLATLGSGNFSPRQIDRAEEWLEDWCTRIGTDPAYDESKHHYCVDLAGDAGPVRVSSGMKMIRPLFLRTTYLYRDIMTVRPNFLEQSMTSSLGLHALNPLKEYLDLLDHLQRMWTSAPSQAPQRASERTEVPPGTMAEVVLGFAAVRALCDAGGAGAGVRRAQWKVQEQSKGGLGMVSSMRSDAAPMAQQLIALRFPDESIRQLGVIVRAIQVPSQQVSRIGVRLLAREAVLVTLSELPAANAVGQAAPKTHRVFFISGNERLGQADSVLGAAGTLTPNMALWLTTPRNVFTIRINRVVEAAGDWQRLGFQVIEKRSLEAPKHPV